MCLMMAASVSGSSWSIADFCATGTKVEVLFLRKSLPNRVLEIS